MDDTCGGGASFGERSQGVFPGRWFWCVQFPAHYRVSGWVRRITFSKGILGSVWNGKFQGKINSVFRRGFDPDGNIFGLLLGEGVNLLGIRIVPFSEIDKQARQISRLRRLVGGFLWLWGPSGDPLRRRGCGHPFHEGVRPIEKVSNRDGGILSEFSAIKALTSEQVVAEEEHNLEAKIPKALPAFQHLVSRCLTLVSDPDPESISPHEGMADPKDLPVLVAAVREKCPWLVAFNIRDCQPGHPDVVVLKPGEFISRIREQLIPLRCW